MDHQDEALMRAIAPEDERKAPKISAAGRMKQVVGFVTMTQAIHKRDTPEVLLKLKEKQHLSKETLVKVRQTFIRQSQDSPIPLSCKQLASLLADAGVCSRADGQPAFTPGELQQLMDPKKTGSISEDCFMAGVKQAGQASRTVCKGVALALEEAFRRRGGEEETMTLDKLFAFLRETGTPNLSQLKAAMQRTFESPQHRIDAKTFVRVVESGRRAEDVNNAGVAEFLRLESLTTQQNDILKGLDDDGKRSFHEQHVAAAVSTARPNVFATATHSARVMCLPRTHFFSF